MHKYLHFQSYDCHTSTNFKLCAPDEEKLYVFLTLDEQKSQTLTTFLFRVWAERTDGKSLSTRKLEVSVYCLAREDGR